MTMVQEKVRRRFILSASAGLALAIVCGFPIGGWLAETHNGDSAASLTASHLAISAVNRGLWDLNQKRLSLDALAQGRRVAGYDNDVDYHDAAGGVYRLSARFEPRSEEILFVGTGSAAGSTAKKSVELSVKKRPGSAEYVQVAWREIRR